MKQSFKVLYEDLFFGLECFLCSRKQTFSRLLELLLVWWASYFDDEEISSISKFVCLMENLDPVMVSMHKSSTQAMALFCFW